MPFPASSSSLPSAPSLCVHRPTLLVADAGGCVEGPGHPTPHFQKEQLKGLRMSQRWRLGGKSSQRSSEAWPPPRFSLLSCKGKAGPGLQRGTFLGSLEGIPQFRLLLAAGWPVRVDICIYLAKKPRGNFISGAQLPRNWWTLESAGGGEWAVTVQAPAPTLNLILGFVPATLVHEEGEGAEMSRQAGRAGRKRERCRGEQKEEWR